MATKVHEVPTFENFELFFFITKLFRVQMDTRLYYLFWTSIAAESGFVVQGQRSKNRPVTDV